MYEWLKIIKKQQLPTLKNLSLESILSNSISLLPATKILNYWWISSPKFAHDQNSALKVCRNQTTFPFASSDVQLQKTQVSPFDTKKLAVH